MFEIFHQKPTSVPAASVFVIQVQSCHAEIMLRALKFDKRITTTIKTTKPLLILLPSHLKVEEVIQEEGGSFLTLILMNILILHFI